MRTHSKETKMLDAEWLKITRIRLGLDTKDIAKEMHCTRQTVWNIERGIPKDGPSVVLYERILNDKIKERGGLRDIF